MANGIAFNDLTEYPRGKTHITSIDITDSSGNYTDPASTTCGYIRPDATTVAAAAMSKDSTGKYHHDYDISANSLQGVWTSRVTAVTGARTDISDIKFLVT